MRLLLDECVPKRLKDDLAGHDVSHVVETGWSSKRNGELLKLMVAERFDALLTVDQHLEFQQNVRASGIGVVGVRAPRNRLKLAFLLEGQRPHLDHYRPGMVIDFASDGQQLE